MNFFTGGGGDFPPRYSSPNIGRQQAVQPARPTATTVRGEPPTPGEPCVVVISMGHTPGINILRDQAAALSNYPCLVIDIGTDLVNTFNMLRAQVPENAYVVLITNVPEYELQFICAALPTHTILDDIRGELIDPFIPLPGLSNLRPTTVAGDLPVPGEPCVVVITLGKSTEISLLKGRAQAKAELQHYPCLVIDVGTDFNAMDVLRNCVPSNANVVLITEAPDAEVDTILAALPSQTTILDDIRRNCLNPFEVVFPLLDAIPYQAAPSLGSSHGSSNSPQLNHIQQGYGHLRPQASMHMTMLLASSPLLLSEELDRFWHARTQARDLRRDRSPLPDPVQNAPVPVTASNPTKTLFEALDLSPDLRESPAWHQLEQTHDLSLLATLVKRALKEAKNSHLIPMLRRLVEEMAAKPALAERVFAALKDGDETCVDRVSFTLHQAELALLVQPALDRMLTKEEMFNLARKVFRRTCIDELAKDKVKEINADRRTRGLGEHEDEIETHLAYYSGLHESLELGGEKPYGKFISSPISGVDANDLEAAERKVLGREGRELWGFFATWTPWQAVLRNKYPNEVREIEEALADADYWAKIQREVNDDLNKRDVPQSVRQDALTQELKKRGQEKQRELWLPLTMTAWKEQNA